MIDFELMRSSKTSKVDFNNILGKACVLKIVEYSSQPYFTKLQEKIFSKLSSEMLVKQKSTLSAMHQMLASLSFALTCYRLTPVSISPAI